MNDLTPIPPQDGGFQLMEPMANSPAPPAPKFRPKKFLFFLRKFWWIPLVTLALGFGTAVAIFYKTPPTFVSYGNLVETEKLQLPGGTAFSGDSGNSFDRENYLGTMADMLRDEAMRNQTLALMGAYATNQIVSGSDGKPIPVAIQVFSSPKSSIYTLEARSANPAFTKSYLDALMQTYLDYRKTTRRNVSADTLASISEQVQRMAEDMKKGQQALNEYQQSNNFAVLVEETTVEASYLAKLRTELSDYQLDFQLLAAKELEADSGISGATNSSDTIFNALNNSGSAASSPSGRMDAEQQISLLKADRERLSKYLLPKHPKIVKLDEEIAHAQNLLDVYSKQNHEQIAAARKSLQIKIDSVGQVIKEYEDRLADANKKIAIADGLKQDVLRNQGMYDRLTALVQNVDVSRNIDQDTLAVLDHASPSTRSYTEAKTMLVHDIIIGLALGLGIVFLIAWRDDRFDSLVEVTERFGDSVVGQVPEIPEFSSAEPLALLDGADDRHMYAESYRNLRSALLYLGSEGQRPKVVLITSAVPNEGKSTIATNLARALAMGGSKVLLVDGDLRKGRIHDMLKLQSKPGFSDLLRQPDEPSKFIQATDLPNFAFLSRGGIIRNPGDLFLSSALDQILARFREQYDHVVIDSCPVFAADDTSALASRADGTLFVVRSRFSHARVVREALELLFQRQARVLGLIVNRSDPSIRSYHYYKYAEYYSSANAAEADKGS